MASEQYLECAVCGATVPLADAIGAGWKAYGPLSEGEDPFRRAADANLSIRCNLCALGSVIVASAMSVEGEPQLEEALAHYRDALRRKEWSS